MFGLGSKNFQVIAPLTGAQVPMENVPDPVFSEKVLGDGVAIEPADVADCVVKSPCDGEIAVLFPTGHAVGVKTKPESAKEIEFLIHLGIDTVELKEGCFETLVKQGDTVKAGQPLIRFDLAKIRAAGKATVTPVVVATPDSITSMKILPGPYKAGETPIMELSLKETK